MSSSGAGVSPADKYLFYCRRADDNPDPKAGGVCWFQPSDSDGVPEFKTTSPSHVVLNVVRENLIPFVCSPTQAEKLTWHVVCNPAAGGGKAKALMEKAVVPLLEFVGVGVETHLTEKPGDAGTIAKLVEVEEGKSAKPPVLVLLGGDGTTAEVLNGLVSFTDNSDCDPPPVPALDLILIPLGTANALFFSRYPSANINKPRDLFASLLSALFATSDNTRPPPRGLPIAAVRCVHGSGKNVHQSVSHVVASTALHAALIKTADELRAEIEGLDRFKKAFEANATRVWNGQVELFPQMTDESILPPTIYNSDKRTFEKAESVTLEGPFSYFASALVDRFEQTFIIAPHRTPPSLLSSYCDVTVSGSIDVIIVRPRRKPALKDTPELELGVAFAADLGQVMGKAYMKGAHVDMKYNEGGGDFNIVEYFRCGGWRWTPRGEEQHVCVDGTVVPIPMNGHVEVATLANSQIRVH